MKPSRNHESRRALLDTFAILAGFSERMPLPLFDGCIPDVFRVSKPHRAIFIGDAKHTETPECIATMTRLQHYAAWLSGAQGVQTDGSLAICHSPGQADRWAKALQMVAHEAGLVECRIGTTALMSDAHVTLVTARGLSTP
jgi:hypothetical protein